MPPRRVTRTRTRSNPTNTGAGSNKASPSGSSKTFLFLVLAIIILIVLAMVLREPLGLRLANGTSSTIAFTTSSLRTVTTSPAKNMIVDGGSNPATQTSTTQNADSNQNLKTTSTVRSNNSISTSVAAKQLKKLSIYMVNVSSDGRMSLENVSRSVDFGESPLTASIQTLLKGPSGQEISSGLVSMVPVGTRLLSAWVSNDVAFLNFNENFMFNPLGTTGLAIQLRQIVFVATEFPTVKKVQILIDGKKTDYLGGDNVFVGKPLGRADFR